jgi:hypothetical protein
MHSTSRPKGITGSLNSGHDSGPEVWLWEISPKCELPVQMLVFAADFEVSEKAVYPSLFVKLA